jgi:hypothetical protein
VKNQKIKCVIRKEGDKKLIEFQKDYITGNNIIFKRKINPIEFYVLFLIFNFISR